VRCRRGVGYSHVSLPCDPREALKDRVDARTADAERIFFAVRRGVTCSITVAHTLTALSRRIDKSLPGSGSTRSGARLPASGGWLRLARAKV